MKRLCKSIMPVVALWALILIAPVYALTDYGFVSVNGDTTATSAVQGDAIYWGANCAVGAMMQWEIWADLNQDSVIDENSDFLLVMYMSADGDTTSDGPPSDTDPVPDGWYITAPMILGLAPTNYILRATDMSDMTSVEKSLVFEELMLPPNQITGTVSIAGVSAPDTLLENIWVQAETDSLGFQLWAAFTDNTGAYSLNIGNSGTGYTFEVYPGNIPGYVAPSSQYLTANGVISGIDFNYGAPSDSIYGYVTDPDDNPISPVGVWCMPNGGGPEKYYDSYDGYYVIYFTAAELGEWMIGVSDAIEPQYMVPQSYLFDNSILHSFEYNLVCPYADTVIYFTVTEDGGSPTRPYKVQAYSSELEAFADAISSVDSVGPYALRVSSDQSSGYMVMLATWDSQYPIPVGYTVIGNYFGIMPGDTVEFSLVQGKLVCDTVVFDPGDETVPWEQVNVSYNGASGFHTVHPAGDGSYQFYVDTGSCGLSANANSYLATPGNYAFYLTGDTCGGLGFTLNKQHEHIIGQITGVTLPLSGDYWVSAGTEMFPAGYNVSSEQVVNATGEFHIYVCDGEWTFIPPFIPGYYIPPPQMITVSENRDTTINLIFDYSNLVTISDTLKVDPDDPLPNPDSVTVWATNGMQSYSDLPDLNGVYSMDVERGNGYDIYVLSPGYLASPAMHIEFINSDWIGAGLGFTLNQQHCLIDGYIQGVPFPLVSDYYVLGGTAEYPDGYHIGSNAVNHATGNFGFYVCDGVWTFYPPEIPGYEKPDTVILIIGEPPDNNRTVNFVYTISSDAPDGREAILPEDYNLRQNHPNPFNATTSITFDLPSRANVNIMVYNILGQPVTTIAEGDFAAGTHTVIWDGNSTEGVSVSSGIYFYRMSAGNNTIVRKMVVLK